ncbi:MAG: hypothetical protein WDM77_21305 [Steroidobacteraceae bacterium]
MSPGLNSVPFGLGHLCARGPPDGNSAGIKAIKAEYVDSKVIRRNALPVERVNTASSAEIVGRYVTMELIRGQEIATAQERKGALLHLNHQGVLPATDRAVAGCQLSEIGFNLEGDLATMTASPIQLNSPCSHFQDVYHAEKELAK